MRSTVAPWSASSMAQNGPGPMPASSSTRRPASGPRRVGCGAAMVIPPHYATAGLSSNPVHYLKHPPPGGTVSSLAGRDAGLGAPGYVGLLLQGQGTTIADVYEARMVLEPACARLLARRRTKQDLADLTSCIEDMAPEPALWSSRAARFHELIMQRSGSKTLAVQGGVLQDIVATHLAMALSRDRAGDDELANFRRNVRSYEKLVALVDKRDGAGAERHWRAHMEAAGQRLLREDLQSRSVVDLFS